MSLRSSIGICDPHIQYDFTELTTAADFHGCRMNFSFAYSEYLAWLTGAAAIYQCMKLWAAIRSQFWPWVEGTVIEADVQEIHVNDGRGYDARLRYEYRVAGKKYQGERLSFRPVTSSNAGRVVEALDGVRAGGTHRVHFAPGRPGMSVLVPGASMGNYLLLAGLLLATVLLFYLGINDAVIRIE
jgi:hypothetical protein